MPVSVMSATPGPNLRKKRLVLRPFIAKAMMHFGTLEMGLATFIKKYTTYVIYYSPYKNSQLIRYLCLSSHPYPAVWVRHIKIPTTDFLTNLIKYSPSPISKRYLPHTMSKTAETTESPLIKAYETAKREEKPNISKIAREYGVSQWTLYNRVKKGATTRSSKEPANKKLNSAQKKVLKC